MRSPVPPERSGALLVPLDAHAPDPGGVPLLPASMPVVVVGEIRRGDVVDARWLERCDVVAEEGAPALDRIIENVQARPIACTTLALLLRRHDSGRLDDGLVAESAAYSVLQAGPEFASWRAAHPTQTGRGGDDESPRVRAEREGALLRVTLTRPQRLNALDARMRDELVEALTVAAADPGVESVEIRGEGRAFCAGGDLDEFGSRADPASAHVVRLERSVGRVLAGLAERGRQTAAFVHGACVGSGIELAAFAGRVVAAPDTEIALPEIGLGLIPGAGGTVSLRRRAGRLRTAWLAFSGCSIDAPTAHEWGLVDEVADGRPA